MKRFVGFVAFVLCLLLTPVEGKGELLDLVDRADRLRDELLTRLRFESLEPQCVVGRGEGVSLQSGSVHALGHYRLRREASLSSFLRACEDYGRIMAPLCLALRNELHEGAFGLRLEASVLRNGKVSDGVWTRAGPVSYVHRSSIDGQFPLSPTHARNLLERVGNLLSFHNTLGRGLLVKLGLWDRARLLANEGLWVSLRLVTVPYSGPSFIVEGLKLRSELH